MNTQRIVSLECCCCGSGTKGRQWWNRDDGYGLCASCVEYCNAKVEYGVEVKEYGLRGYHYDLPSDLLTRTAVEQAVSYGMTYAEHGAFQTKMAEICESVTEVDEVEDAMKGGAVCG